MPPCSVAVGGKPVQFDANAPHQQQTHPVGRHGSRYKDQSAHDLIKPAVLIDCTEEANGDAEHRHNDKRSSCQLKGRRQAAQQLACHGAFRVDIADAKVAVETAQHPIKITDKEGVVQTKLLFHRSNDLIRDHGGLLDTQCDLCRIGGDQIDKAEANALSKALHDVNIKVDDLMLIRYNKINSSQWKLLEKGIITREEIKLRRFKILFEEFSLNADPKEVARNYQEYLGQGHYFIKDAEEVLEQLSKTHRIYLVTNGTLSVQKGRIESSGIKKYLQGVFISEEVGYNKPSKEYFEYCFSHIPDFKKENTAIIGDSLSSDIQGGKNAGIKTIWFHRQQDQTEKIEPKPDYEIRSLKLLLDVLR